MFDRQTIHQRSQIGNNMLLCHDALSMMVKGAIAMRNSAIVAAMALTLLQLCTHLSAQDKLDLSKLPLPKGQVASSTVATRAALVCFLEGPAVDAEGNVFFSDIVGNRILTMNSRGETSVFRSDSGRANGNAFDAAGRLITCEGLGLGAGGRRRLVRTDLKTGETKVLTERYEGKRYNSPNDVCVDGQGRIWFTDPRYGDRADMELDVEGVYRIDPDGRVAQVIGQPHVQKPNGIAVAPDGNTLYVADSNDAVDGNRKVWAWNIARSGELDGRRLLFDFAQGRGGDGIRTDCEGNVWIAAGIQTPRPPGEVTDVPPGIYVVSPHGKLLGRIPIPEDYVTNLAFGGRELKTLYVTAGTSIYQFPVAVSGYAAYPAIRPKSARD
jgi:gluconolactonase